MLYRLGYIYSLETKIELKRWFGWFLELEENLQYSAISRTHKINIGRTVLRKLFSDMYNIICKVLFAGQYFYI